jgi:hypothetical protein
MQGWDATRPIMFSSRADTLRFFSPHLTADVELYPAAMGGRQIAIFPGWGCPCFLTDQGPSVGHDAWLLLGDTPLAPGQARRLGFYFLHPHLSVQSLRSVGIFYLWEGKFIGKATIVP